MSPPLAAVSSSTLLVVYLPRAAVFDSVHALLRGCFLSRLAPRRFGVNGKNILVVIEGGTKSFSVGSDYVGDRKNLLVVTEGETQEL